MNFKRFHVSKNLFDKGNTTIYSAYIGNDARWITISDGSKSIKMPVDSNTQYTLSISESNSVFRIYETSNSNPEPSAGGLLLSEIVRSTNIKQYTFTTASDTKFIVFQGGGSTVDSWFNSLMLNTGSQPLPYEPYSSEVWHDIPHYIMGTSTDTLTTLPADIYANDTTATVGLKGNMSQSGTPTPTAPIQPQECGDLETSGTKAGQYKIPILNNSQTTNVYLGEAESTRRIKKLVLTGNETYQNYSYSNTDGVQILNMLNTSYSRTNGLCNIYPVSTAAGSTYCLWIGSGSNDRNLYFVSILSAMGLTDASEFKSWVAQQYSAGTPVTIWYVLATPETAVVNEPLRKIGTYADEVSGITIPTIAGTNTLSVDTTLQPSEVTTTYKGWHPVSAVHERENGAWD